MTDAKHRRVHAVQKTALGIGSLFVCAIAVLLHEGGLAKVVLAVSISFATALISYVVAPYRPVLAGNLACAGVYAGTVLVATIAGGWHARFLLGLLIVPLLGGLLSGLRSGFAWAVATLATIFVFILVDRLGVELPQLLPIEPPNLAAFLGPAMFIGTATWVMWSFVTAQAFSDKTAREALQSLEQEIDLRKKEELERSRTIGLLAAGIAHDFNNILATMSLNLELAKLQTSDTEMLTMLDDTETAVMQAQSLTAQMVTFAPGDSAQMEPVNLNEVLAPVSRFAARGLNIKIDLQCDPALPSVAIDSNQIAHVIHNLIRNANTAMPKGGTLSIHGLVEDDMVVVRFADQGVGIPDSDLAKIFDPWFTSSKEGVGLGLAIAHSVMQQHGGDITVKSEVGKGSVFTLSLPAFTGTQDNEPAAAPAELRNLHVLIMDDNIEVRKALVRLTAAMGCDISECDDGSAAFELWSRARDLGQAFDILILDIEVPGGTGGVETLRQIHQIDPKARAIAISGYSSEGVISHPEHYGFSAALKKPFTKASLNRVLHELA